MKKTIIFLMLVCVFACSAAAERNKRRSEAGVGLTIYNDNLAIVRETRQMSFERGVNAKRFTDVASAIDPTSVKFECISSPRTISILEQNYEYDLVNTNSLLKRYIDKLVKITIKGSGADEGREVMGKLLASLGSDLILQTKANDIEIINKSSIEDISLQKLPEDLVTKPTLVWLVESQENGLQLCRVAYMTGQVNWRADYSAVLNADETRIDFSGWVTIDNKSGAGYKDATIKLIAGDVHRVKKPRMKMRERFALAMDAVGAGFEEKPFMEYHLYTLGRKSTINNNQVKQIEFIPMAYNVSVNKLYIFERSTKTDKIQVKIECENTKKNHLGIALPKGKIRVFKNDPADDTLEFVGEDEIDHTARKEKLSLYIGDAFDIVPEYTLVDAKRSRRMRCEKHKIEIRNRKDQAVTVFVDEKFDSWVNWKIDEATHKYEKRDARTARFEVKVEADTVATLEYTATQTW